MKQEDESCSIHALQRLIDSVFEDPSAACMQQNPISIDEVRKKKELFQWTYQILKSDPHILSLACHSTNPNEKDGPLSRKKLQKFPWLYPSMKRDLWMSRLNRNLTRRHPTSTRDFILDREDTIHDLYDQLVQAVHSKNWGKDQVDRKENKQQQLVDGILTVLTWLMDDSSSLPSSSSYFAVDPNTNIFEFQSKEENCNMNSIDSSVFDASHSQENHKIATTNSSSNSNDNKKSHTYNATSKLTALVAMQSALQYEEYKFLRECILALQHVNGENVRYYYHHHSVSNASTLPRQLQNPYTQNMMIRYEGLRIRPNILPFHPDLSIEWESFWYSKKNLDPKETDVLQQRMTVPAQQPELQSQSQYPPSRRLLGSGTLDLVRICGEAGWLCAKIQHFIHTTLSWSTSMKTVGSVDAVAATATRTRNDSFYSSLDLRPGRIARALASVLAQEMQSFQKWIASIEQQCFSNTTMTKKNKQGKGEENGMNSTSTAIMMTTNEKKKIDSSFTDDMTSRRLLVQLRLPLTTLRSLAILADGISPTIMGGGEILTALYLHSMHGDDRHKDLIQKILHVVSKPWYDMLFQWTMEGKLFPTTLKEVNGANDLRTRNDKDSNNLSNSFLFSNSTRNDFFVIESTNMESMNNLWHDRYKINPRQIPFLPNMISRVNTSTGSGHFYHDTSTLFGRIGSMAVTADYRLAAEILIVGKAVNFIRQCLHDSDWVLDLDVMLPKDNRGRSLPKASTSQMNDDDIKLLLGYRYCPEEVPADTQSAGNQLLARSPLRRTIAQVASQVHKHILTSLFNDYHLIQHLRGLKDFLLLGQGDFINALMDSMHTAFYLRVTSKDDISLHRMTTIVNDALRSTNAIFLPKFVRHSVGAKLLSPPTSDKVCFWLSDKRYPSSKLNNQDDEDPLELFTLEYTIDSPLTAVVYHTIMEKYQRIFAYLFRLKRIEWLLNHAWKQSKSLHHTVDAITRKYTKTGVTKDTDETLPQVNVLLRKLSLTRQSMLHFISNLQSYLMFEVLESGWKELISQLKNSSTLDEVITAHNSYLDTIIKKSLLGVDGSLNSTKLERQLRVALTIAYRFCTAHHRIFVGIKKSIDIETANSLRKEIPVKPGKWRSNENDSDVNGHILHNETTLKDILSMSFDFEESVRELLALLNYKMNDNLHRVYDDSSTMHSPSDAGTISSSSVSDLGSWQSRGVGGKVVESDALPFLAFRLDFSDYYERGP